MVLELLQKTAEATGDLISNKIANRIAKVSKTLQQNNSKTVANKHDKEIPKEIYISRRKARNHWWTKVKDALYGLR